jgi:hypothetical protein
MWLRRVFLNGWPLDQFVGMCVEVARSGQATWQHPDQSAQPPIRKRLHAVSVFTQGEQFRCHLGAFLQHGWGAHLIEQCIYSPWTLPLPPGGICTAWVRCSFDRTVTAWSSWLYVARIDVGRTYKCVWSDSDYANKPISVYAGVGINTYGTMNYRSLLYSA